MAIFMKAVAPERSLETTGTVVKSIRRLQKAINKHVKSWEKDRDERRQDIFHASEMGRTCPRWQILRRRPEYAGKNIEWEPKMLLTFEIGREIERVYRQRILGPMGILEGTWKCDWCGAIHEGRMPQPSFCGTKVSFRRKDSGDSEWRLCLGEPVFQEEGIWIVDLKMSGHPDGRGRWEHLFFILELKTDHEEKFRERKGPDGEHEVQTTPYMGQTGIYRVLYIYICKSTGARTMYWREYSEQRMQRIREDVADHEERIAADNPHLVTRPPECRKPTQAMAKRCPGRFFCHPEAFTLPRSNGES